jgi:hypothetical protein
MKEVNQAINNGDGLPLRALEGDFRQVSKDDQEHHRQFGVVEIGAPGCCRQGLRASKFKYEFFHDRGVPLRHFLKYGELLRAVNVGFS